MRTPVRNALLALLSVCALCAAFSANAGAASWKWSKPYSVGAGVDGLACPSTAECLGFSGNQIIWSTNPTGGASTWHRAAIESTTSPFVQGSTIGLTAISCPSVSFCVATDNVGNAFVSDNPTGGAAAWAPTSADQNQIAEILAVSCSSGSLCAAVDYNGNALTSSSPSVAWTAVALGAPANADFYGVSCAGAALCVAVASTPKIYFTTDPGAAGTPWESTALPGDGFDDVSCPSISLCVATGGYDSSSNTGRIAVSTSPTGGAPEWKSVIFRNLNDAFSAVDCHSASSCVALVGGGVYTSSAPQAKASAWKLSKIAGNASETALTCPTNTECLVGTSTGTISIGKRK